SLAGAGTRGLGLLLVAGCVAGSLAAGTSVTQWYGLRHTGTTVELGLVVFLLVGGHVAVIRWAVRRHPPRWQVAITQAPFLAGYAATVAWRLSVRALDRPTGFPLVYPLWAAAAVALLAWLTIWYAREARDARRAIAYLSTVAILLLANGAGIFAIRWQATNAFGFAGQPSPWGALRALSASSCLTAYRTYQSGDHLVRVSCPDGPDADFYAGAYDAGHFNDALCAQQPRSAFQPWWDRNRQYHRIFQLDFQYGLWSATVDGAPVGTPLPPTIDGRSATIALEVAVTVEQTGTSPVIAFDHGVEHWTVHAQSVRLGGWKVCRIDIADPIQVRAVPVRPVPSPSTSDDLLGGLRSMLPCAPQDPFPQYHNCPSVTPTPAVSSPGP
ncbi:MAG: hypothetical protein J2P15_21760, partial [Micromonosporaceae bacterium]|nr:hypothetical protein [Micromonosporaceae bacterium]